MNLSSAIKNYLLPQNGVKLEHYIVDASIIISIVFAYNLLTQ